MNTFTLTTEEALRLEFWQLENELQVRREAQEKARQEQEALIMAGQLSESAAAFNIITTATLDTVTGLAELMEETMRPSRGKPRKSLPACKILAMLPETTLRNIVADCIAMCLNGVGLSDDNALIHAFGKHVEHEFMLKAFHEEDRKAAKFLKDTMSKQALSQDKRYGAVEYSLSANRLQWVEWKEDQIVILGQILYHVIVTHSNLFDIETVTEVF